MEDIKNPKLKEIVDGLDKRVEQENAEIISVLEKISSITLNKDVDSCQQISKKWEIIHAHLSKEAGKDVATGMEMVDMKEEINALIGPKNEKKQTKEDKSSEEHTLDDSDAPVKDDSVPTPVDDEPEILLDHFVYYPLMDKGYTNEPTVWNPDFSPMIYVERCFVTDDSKVKINLVHPSKKYGHPELMYFSSSQKKDVVISLASRVNSADEKGREGYKSHVVVVKKEHLKDRTISLLSVIKAMMKFDEDNKKPVESIPPLAILKENNREFLYKSKLKGVTEFSLAATANHLTISSYNKVNYVIKAISTEKKKNPLERLMYTIYLIELLNIDCGIEDFNAITTEPKDWNVAKKFSLFVTNTRMTDQIMAVNPAYWKWYKSSEEGNYNILPVNAHIYEKIKTIP
jgi:hypothetical protein